MKVEVTPVNWFSTYHVHHRVTDHFRKGRAFLLGDAAHIHSPAGGQGMNTGIGDAINLAWKLAAVLARHARPTRCSTATSPSGSPSRGGWSPPPTAPSASPPRRGRWPTSCAPGSSRWSPRSALSQGAVREFMFRTVSQITLNYRGSPLSAGKAGRVEAGDRLPWVRGADLPANLDWQARVHGEPPEALALWSRDHGLDLLSLPWSKAAADAGLRQDALYLLRPDTYVALVDPAASPQTLAHYFDARGLALSAK